MRVWRSLHWTDFNQTWCFYCLAVCMFKEPWRENLVAMDCGLMCTSRLPQWKHKLRFLEECMILSSTHTQPTKKAQHTPPTPMLLFLLHIKSCIAVWFTCHISFHCKHAIYSPAGYPVMWQVGPIPSSHQSFPTMAILSPSHITLSR